MIAAPVVLPDPATLFSVAGKVALVTGATGGFGAAAAHGLAAGGAHVMLTGRTAASLEALETELVALGYSVSHVAGDPVSEADNVRIVAETVAKFGGIDILVASAGTNKPSSIVNQPLEEWEEIMDVNVKGSWLICKEVGKQLLAQGRGGKVILVSSARGKLGMANYSAYCPSKAAIDLLTRSLGCEWGAHGINVNAIAPTVFRTALTQWMFEDDAVYKNFLRRIPLARLGEPGDFVGPVLFLSSAASDFMTGSVMYVDGGYTAG